MMASQTVIITGASRGLGAAASRIAAQLEANVVLNARSLPALEAVHQDIEAKGGRALVVPGDVSRLVDCERIVGSAVEHYGGIDALINNAGVIDPIAPIYQADLKRWERNLAINLLGPLMLIRAALPFLRQSKGRVINVSSGAAVKVIPGWGAYSVAKTALNHLTRFLAVEEEDITCIAFRPGVVDTEMQADIRRLGESGMPAKEYEHFVRMYREGQLHSPEIPGRALVAMALYAPAEWSGAFLSWEDEEVQALVERYIKNA